MINKAITALALTGAICMSGSAQAGEATARMLADTCAGCHGTDGGSQGPASPSIAGLDASYFLKSMLEYKSGARQSTIMGRIARGYTDAQLKAMADYFASKPYVIRVQKHDVAQADLGMRIHEMHCAGCHEDMGKSNTAEGPALAGQIKPYLAYSMEDFMKGHREGPSKMNLTLKSIRRTFGDAGIDALANFYASHRP